VRAILVLLLTAGCRQLLGFEQPIASDGPVVDGSPDGGDGSSIVCVGAPDGLLGNTCFSPASTVLLVGNALIDTDTSMLCDADSTAHCFVTGTAIEISGNLVVQGSRALVLWSATTITASGTIDAASHVGKTGPGASPPNCQVLDAGVIASIPMAGAGGSGASYANAGGHGGTARTGGSSISNGEVAPSVPAAMVGGCVGGNGGLTNGSGGQGGGAIYLVAGSKIVIKAVINASGVGGSGGFVSASAFGGGGGGGSGGLIGLDAPTLVLDGATLVALGGGGGAGATTSAGGSDGTDPIDVPPSQGLGGAATVAVNNGGSGGSLVGGGGSTGGNVQNNEVGGGGGGGGGPGHIVGFGSGTIMGSTVAPPLVLN
jgi:hypothetical protein